MELPGPRAPKLCSGLYGESWLEARLLAGRRGSLLEAMNRDTELEKQFECCVPCSSVPTCCLLPTRVPNHLFISVEGGGQSSEEYQSGQAGLEPI